MTQQPIAKFRAGGVSGAIWENEINVGGQTKSVLKVTVGRRFKDKNGVWRSTASFSRNEIPLAIHCLQKAFERMLEGEESDTAVEEIAIGA